MDVHERISADAGRVVATVTPVDGLVTVDEAALLLRLTARTVRAKIAAGELRAERIGRGPRAAYRIWSSSIAAFLRANAGARIETRR